MKSAWVYIASASRSGSTMLDAMLGNVDGIRSVGELVSGIARPDVLCSCGKAKVDCTYWSGVPRRFHSSPFDVCWDDAVRETVGQADIRRIARTLRAHERVSWVRRLRSITEQMGDAIGNGSGLVVDSSKELSRALFLLRFVPGSKVIHLIRHPIGVVGSYHRSLADGRGFKFRHRYYRNGNYQALFLLLACLRWTAVNLIAYLMRLWHRDRMICLRYEDFLETPVRELSRLESFLNVSLHAVCDRIMQQQEFEIHHAVAGNPMRMAGRFRFDPQRASRRQLPLPYRVMTRAICWPVMLLYGYR